MPKQNPKITTTSSTNHGKCSLRAHEPGSNGCLSWVVTKRRSRAEVSSGEKTEATGAEVSFRVCVDCQASTTPLWRNGPHGPLTLCNACGIRYRKRKLGDVKEEKAQNLVSKSGDGASKSMEVMVYSEEELRRRQREKQEKILTVLLCRKVAGKWRRRCFPARTVVGGDRKGEVAEAALLLLSMSTSGMPAHV